MMHEAFVRAVEAEQARQRELALLVHRVVVDAPRPVVRGRARAFSRLTELARFLQAPRRRPRHLAAADVADQIFAG
jgi:hypothetical protein